MIEKAKNILRRIFVRNFHLKFIALLLTFAVHLWVGDDRETQVISTAPVQPVVPDDLVLTSPTVDRVRVTLRGRWSSLNQLDHTSLEPINIRLDSGDDGSLVPIAPNLVNVPPGVRVVSVEPSFMRVELENRTEKELDINPRLVGDPRESYALGDVNVTPDSVVASGPEGVLEDRTVLPTEPIDVTGRARTFKKQVQLRPDNPHIQYDLGQPVVVEVPIEAEEIQRTIRETSVRAVNTTYETSVQPEDLRLTVRGPRSLVENLDPSRIHAIIDMSTEDDRQPGTFEKRAEVRNLPDDVEIVRMHPTHFLVTTREVSTN